MFHGTECDQCDIIFVSFLKLMQISAQLVTNYLDFEKYLNYQYSRCCYIFFSMLNFVKFGLDFAIIKSLNVFDYYNKLLVFILFLVQDGRLF